MRRGQLTSFIIVGIVILFVLALAVYYVGVLKQQTPVIDTPAEKGNLRACLEQSLDLAMLTVAAHGGTDLQNGNGVRLTRAGQTAAEDFRLGVQQYPHAIPNAYQLGYAQSGTLNFQPLCLARGPNRPNTAGSTANDCLSTSYQTTQPDDAVLQYQLALLTSANAEQCGVVDPVQVLFGADDVTATAGNITVRNAGRFKRVYNAARAVARVDVLDALFDKRSATSVGGCLEPSANNECLLAGMVLSVSHEQGVDIVSITDTARTVAGQDLVFSYAVANRPPVFIGYEPSTLPLVGITIPPSPATVVIHAADADEFDVLSASCSGALVSRCDVTTTGFSLDVTLAVDGCTSTPGGTTDSVSVTVADDAGNSNTLSIPVFVQQSSSCS